MKKKVQNFLLLILSIVLSPLLQAQNLYELDLSNSAINCTTTCGLIIPAHWRVSNANCNLITDPIYYPSHPDDSLMVTQVSIDFVSVGNFSCGATHSEGIIISSSINNGSWYVQSRIFPCNITSNFFTSFKLHAPADATVKLKVNVVVNGNNSKHIRINNGKIIVGEALVANSTNWVKRTINNGGIKGEMEIENSLDWERDTDVSEHNSATCRFSEADQTLSLMKESTTTSILSTSSPSPSFKIFPNPADGSNFTVKITGSKEEKILLILYDQLGQEHYAKVLINNDGQFLEVIDYENKLNPGVYLIVGTNRNEFYRQTLIVK